MLALEADDMTGDTRLGATGRSRLELGMFGLGPSDPFHMETDWRGQTMGVYK